MSSWTKFRNTAIKAVATYYGGAAGAKLVQNYQDNRNAQGQARDAERFQQAAMPGVGSQLAQIKGGADVLRLGGNVAVMGSMGLRTAMRAAATYCKRQPMWCSSLPGGLGSVAQMVMNGQLPAIKRRRRRGISATDLAKFRRVATFLHKWGGMVGGAARAPRRTRAKC